MGDSVIANWHQTCPKCGKSFWQSANLRKHLREKHDENVKKKGGLSSFF